MEDEMSKYMLILKGGDYEKFSPAEMQDIIEEFFQWTDDLKSKGTHVSSDELNEKSKHIRLEKDDLIVTDGPFPETKEVIGGYYVVMAEDEKEAIEVSQGCPHLRYNGIIELHEVIQNE